MPPADGRELAERLRSQLGPTHPDTLACAANLAVALDEMRRVLGDHHPSTDMLCGWHRDDRDLEPQPT